MTAALPAEVLERLAAGETVTADDVIRAEAEQRLAVVTAQITSTTNARAAEAQRLIDVEQFTTEAKARSLELLEQILTNAGTVTAAVDKLAASIAELSQHRNTTAAQAHRLDCTAPATGLDNVEPVGLVASPAAAAFRRHGLEHRPLSAIAAEYAGTAADRLATYIDAHHRPTKGK